MTRTTTAGTATFEMNLHAAVIAETNALRAERIVENIRVGTVTHIWNT